MSPRATPLALAVLLPLLPLLPACDGGPAPDPAVQVRPVDGPLALEFLWDGAPRVRLADPDGPALWLDDGLVRVDPAGPPAVSTDDAGRTVHRYGTTDGRTLVLSFGPSGHGAAEVRVSATSLNPGERFVMRFRTGADEAFYGLTERTVQTWSQEDVWRPGRTEGLDLRGQQVDLEVRPTLGLYSPFFASSAGWGLYVDSDWPGTYAFGTVDPATVELRQEADPAAPEVAFRVLADGTPLQVVQRYARTVGTTILPPEWAFGHWRWRDDHYDLPAFYDGTPYDGPYNSMVVEDVLMMEALGIPCSVYWVDRPWGPGSFGYDDLEWDTQAFPDPGGMIAWLHGRGTRFLLWVVAWAVGPRMTREALEGGFQVDPENPFSAPPSPQAMLIDLTNPRAEAWWQDALVRRIRADGLDGFKCDRGEEKPPDGRMVTGAYDDGTDYREGRNAYPYWYARAVHGAWLKSGVPEFVNIFRSAWRGSQRHAIFWGGDTGISEWGLRSAIVAVQRAAAMNFPLWGSDTCGYSGQATHETCMRWMAFSAFTPLMEVGPTHNAAPWSRVPEGQDLEVIPLGYPYEPVYDTDLVAAWILYANLHEDLRPYTWRLARQAAADGTPVVRPMAFVHPERPEYRDLWTQYFYGPDLVVAPVWQTGQVEARVHVPPEGRWRDAWTGREVAAGTVVALEAPEHRIPLLVRAGSGLDLGDLPARWEAAKARAAQRPDLAALAATVR